MVPLSPTFISFYPKIKILIPPYLSPILPHQPSTLNMMFPLALSNQVITTNTIASALVEVWKQNTGIRFAASGILGNAIFFGLDKLLLPIILHISDDKTLFTLRRDCQTLFKWMHGNAESVSFFVAYLLDIIVQRKT